jgi:hypothetical protein
MKKLILLLMLISSICNAQNSCKIIYLNTTSIDIGGKTLHTGDSFGAEVKINWDKNKKQVMKFCYDNCTKQRVVSSDAFNQNKSMSISDYLFSRGQLLSRSGNLNSVKELKNYFSRTLGLINELRIDIGNMFPMNDHCHFYVSYKYNGEIINKKLPFENSQLIIDRSIYTIEGESISAQKMLMSLFYYDTEKQLRSLITEELVIFPIDSGYLTNWLTELNAPALNNEDRMEIISDYLDIQYPEVYFPTSDLEKWIKEHNN